MGQQSVIISGEDRTLILRIVLLDSQEPYDLVDWTKISVQFRKSDRSLLEKTSDIQAETPSSVIYDAVTYTAITGGIGGNTIALVFNGVDTIQEVVDAWNTANPTNTVSHNGVGTDVPIAGTAQLAGGRDAYSDVEVINTTLGKVSVRLTDADTASLKVGPNQSIKAIIDKGAPPNGNRRIIIFDSVLTVSNAIM